MFMVQNGRVSLGRKASVSADPPLLEILGAD